MNPEAALYPPQKRMDKMISATPVRRADQATWLRQLTVGALLACLACCAGPAHAQQDSTTRDQAWHHWRGPLANGVNPTADPPLTWSPDQNIAWKSAIDGAGSSTPIVWGDKIFLLTAINTGQVDPDLPKPEDQPRRPFGITYPNTQYQFVVLCLDRRTGKEQWRQTAAQLIPAEGHHGDNNFASASPTTDGKRLYCWFGSAGTMVTYDFNGQLLWKRDLGQVNMRRSFGEGSSPVIHGDRLVLNRDNDGQSYVVALDAANGKELWRQQRDELSTWMTPLVVTHAGKTQVICSASNYVRSYDLANGKLLWQCSGQVGNVTPSPVADDACVICMSGYRGSAAYAISLDATGDVSGTDKVSWQQDRGTPYVPSPLLYDGWLFYNQSNDAILSVVNAADGAEVMKRTRIPGLRRVYASPVGAANRVYYVGRDGTTVVLERSDTLRVLATNAIGEPVDASPAVVGKQLFLRGRDHLFCIEAKK